MAYLLPPNYSDLLAKVAETLDIPDFLYEDAVLRYEDVGEWLGAEGSPLAQYTPTVYPQGSFRLGTVIRPITDADQYDIDLVCRISIPKEQTSQAALKKMVGDRLKQRQDLAGMVEPLRRCWRLDYSNAPDPNDAFHLDVLPSLPNVEQQPSGILLTDTQFTRWQKSDPIAYASWFYERMKVALQARKVALAEARKADVADVPDWQVRTPLQRAVQLLKRHRDIYFAKDLDNRPVSIIITTLAAKAYGNQLELGESLAAILAGMGGFIEFKNGKYAVWNPVEPDENFADKWNEKPTLRVAFFNWLEKAKRDFVSNVERKSLAESVGVLSPAIGNMPVSKAAQSLGVPIATRVVPPTSRQPSIPALGTATHTKSALWPERLTGKANVRGGIYMPNRRSKKLWDLSDRALPKNVAIKFNVTTNVKPPYQVKWQVVNTGSEAAASGDLRGDFYDSESSDTRWETTRYAGTHWVEAFIVKDGVCVARSGKTHVRVRV